MVFAELDCVKLRIGITFDVHSANIRFIFPDFPEELSSLRQARIYDKVGNFAK